MRVNLGSCAGICYTIGYRIESLEYIISHGEVCSKAEGLHVVCHVNDVGISHVPVENS